MMISDVLREDLVSPELPGGTKNEIIESLLDLLMVTGKIRDREAALESIHAREEKMSTGIQHGIAIPHGKTDAVDSLLVCFGRKVAGIDFDALDGGPSKLFFMTLSPLDSTGPHIQLLSEISSILNEESVRAKLLEAKNQREIFDILCARE